MPWKELINKLNPKQSKSTLFEYSPSPHLVSSNDAPTEEEHAAIQQAIYNLSSAKPTEERLRALRVIISPLRRFPPELLGEIFVHCLEEQGDLFDNAPPWYLLHICQLWRQVAMSIPKLWRHLPPLIYRSSKKTNKSPMLRFLLQLSSNARLTFLLHQPFLADEVLPLLTLHSDRWERIHLSISEGVFEFLDGFVQQLPSLTAVTITIINFHRPPSTFLRAPNLKVVNFRGCSPWVLYSELPLPWKQLTSFTSVSPIRPNQLMSIATNCHQLERLDIVVSRARNHSPILPTTLPSLTSLVLRTSQEGPIDVSLLPVLTLPSLTELFIGSFLPPSLPKNLSALFTRSGCSLQRLIIDSYYDNLNWSIIDILRLTPQLRYLDINTQTGQPFVQALCEFDRVEGWKFVPHLETLIIRLARMRYQLGQLALARCDLHLGNKHEELQGLQRLRNMSLVSLVPIVNLEGDLGVKVRRPKIPFHLALRDIISTSSTTLNDDTLTYLEKKKWLSRKVDKILSLATKMTAPYVSYLYITTYLWEFYSIVPSALCQELDLKKRFEDVLMLWANTMVRSSSDIRWIWDKYGHLKYIPKSEDRGFLFPHFKRFFFEEAEQLPSNLYPFAEQSRRSRELP